MNILGLTSDSGGFHDSSAVWVRNGEIVYAVSEERISRVKHDYNFPLHALTEILATSGLKPREFDGVAVGWKPYRAASGFFSRNVFDVPATVIFNAASAPRAFLNYASKNFFRKKVIGEKSVLGELGFSKEQIHYFSHHLAHAASAFRTSGYESALSVNLDCFGPDEKGELWSGAAFSCKNNKIDLLEYVPPYASLGLFYSAVSVALGFKFGDGEGKTMGLSAYGNPARAYDRLRTICPRFAHSNWKGHSSWTDFRLIDDPKLFFNSRWGRYLRRLILETSREDIAAAAQLLLEEELTNYFDYLLKKTGLHNVVLAGGIFLNIKFNQMLAARSDVGAVFVHPFPSDGGTAAGAALELGARLFERSVNYAMPSAALGKDWSDEEIQKALEAFDAKVHVTKTSDVAASVADCLAAGEVIGWFQGREEWGPRALGYRSVLANPQLESVKEKINSQLKCRDWFMPFAPSIVEEAIGDYFIDGFYSPFMTFSFKIREDQKSLIPVVSHHDGTARPNVVRQSVNPLYYRLIREFEKRSGIPIVVNTSFNRHGLPIVHTPNEAVEHLLWGCVDRLAIGCYIVQRKNQPEPPSETATRALRNAYVDNQALSAAFDR